MCIAYGGRVGMVLMHVVLGRSGRRWRRLWTPETSSHFPFRDRTVGNSLRFTLNKDPRVAFCGYSTPHPSENRINVQVQTTGVPVRDVLKDALNDLTAMNQYVTTTFDRTMEGFRAMKRFKANQGMMELSMKSGVTSQHSDNVKHLT